MKVLRLLGYLGFIGVVVVWTYVGVFLVVNNPTMLPVLIFGAVVMCGLIVMLVHQEIFG